jgi:hypothetical protein
MEAVALILISIALLAVLVIWEYRNYDCINGKPCRSGVVGIEIDPSAPLSTNIERINEAIKSSINYNVWALALIVALLLAIPIDYLINGYFPTVRQWLITVLLIFIGAYFSASWLWSHWVQPNAAAIQHNLLRLA